MEVSYHTFSPSPMYPTRRIANRLPKMFRFSEGYRKKTCKNLSFKRSKIGTFLDAVQCCGGGFQRGRIFVAPLWPTSLVTFLFGDKKVTLPH